MSVINKRFDVPAEEELLAGITSNTACNVSTCERLLLNHADVFHVGRYVSIVYLCEFSSYYIVNIHRQPSSSTIG